MPDTPPVDAMPMIAVAMSDFRMQRIWPATAAAAVYFSCSIACHDNASVALPGSSHAASHYFAAADTAGEPGSVDRASASRWKTTMERGVMMLGISGH